MTAVQALLECVESADAPSQEEWLGLRETVRGCAAQLQQLQEEQAARLQKAEDVVAAVRQLEVEGVLGRDSVAAKVHRMEFARVCAKHPPVAVSFVDSAAIPDILRAYGRLTSMAAMEFVVAKVSRGLRTSTAVALAGVPPVRALCVFGGVGAGGVIQSAVSRYGPRLTSPPQRQLATTCRPRQQ